MIRAVVSSLVLMSVAVALIYRAGVSSSAANSGSNRSPASITVLCAAGLAPVMADLTHAFETASSPRFDIKVDVSYKGSAQLVALQRVAQSGDLLIAADTFYHQTLVDQGLCSPAVAIAHQTPCLIIAGSVAAPRSLEEALTSGKFRTSVPKRDHAAIGRLVASIEGDQRYDRFAREATVTRETVSQVASDVDQGIADIGIAWNTTALQFENAKPWIVDAWQQHRSSIGVSVLSSVKNVEAAQAFERFMTGDVAKSILEQHGYGVDDFELAKVKP
jgi:molybdate transport system substrate-binding protein